MSTNSDIALAAAGMRYSFGDREVLRGIDLQVRRGEVFGLLGPNGSGKSTLLSLLTGSRPLTSGSVSLGGVVMDPASRAYRRSIGVVFQSPALDGKLSARENLQLTATMYGLRGTAARQAVESGLSVARLEERADSVVGELSGGMRRRLDIARALLPRPRVLFMDEPSTGLDEASYRALWAHLEEANRREGVTIVVSTHRSDEAERCHRLCVIDRGAAVATATPRELCASLADDLVVLSCADPDSVVSALVALELSAERVGDEVHVGANDAHALVPRIFESLPRGAVSAVSVRRPGLSDAYLALTGHALDGEVEEAA